MELLESRQMMAGDITGTVFNDLNANGIDDPGENGLAGWTVFVDSNGSGTLNPGELSTVTDSKGKYAILGVPAGIRDVYEIPQPGFKPTPGFSDHQTIEVRDQREVRVKFGNVTAPIVNGSIGGAVFNDVNENGVKDSSESGLSGWTMFLDDNGDGLLTAGEASVVTDSDGDYLFTDVPEGTKTVYEIPQGGYQPTAGGLFPAVGASPFRTVSVVGGSTANADFANSRLQIGTIQGNVFQDRNGDAFKAPVDSPMAGVSVFVDLNGNQAWDAAEPVRTTDAAGAYSFVGIRAGSYRVQEIIPAGYVAAVAAPSSQVVGVVNGGVTALDFFNVVPGVGSVTGKVFDDFNGNGAQDVGESSLGGLQVFLDANNNATLDVGERQAVTAGDGSYSFANVPYGATVVRNVLPTNWLATSPSTSARQIVVLNDEVQAGVNFGARENVGAIRGTVWNDDNGDGIHQATETGVANRTVFLDLNLDGQPNVDEPAVATDAAGVYQFARVPVGSYDVTHVVPADWTTAVGTSPAVSTNVQIGRVNTVDFHSLVPRLGSISGVVFSDLDSNGLRNGGEPGLEGIQVYADLNNNAALDDTDVLAISDATGGYSLVGVPYGRVTVREILLPSYGVVNYPSGAASIVLLNGEHRTGLNFATKEPVDFVISGVAWFDANHDGVRQASERGLSGIKVYLDANNNGALDAGESWTTTSVDQFYTPDVNELGTYAFTHLARGDYVVREILPSELDATTAEARVKNVTLGPGSVIDVNFANVYRANEIHGVVFDDTDYDHAYDPTEHLRSGVEVYIDLDRDDVYDEGEPLTVSGADGSYAFLGLSPGAYIVRERGDYGPKSYPTNGGGILWPAGTSNAPVGNVSPTLIQQSLELGQTYRQSVSLTLPTGGGLTNLVDVFLLFDDTGSFAGNSPIVRAAFPDIISRLQTSLPGVDLGFGVGRLEEYGGFAAEFASGRPFILNQPIVASSTTDFSLAIQSALDRMAPGYGGDAPETDIEALFQVVTGRGFDGNSNGSVLDSGPAGLALTQTAPGGSGDVPSFDSFTPDPAHGILPADGSIGGAGFRPGALPIILTATDTGFAYQPKGESTIVGAGGVTLPLSVLTQASRPSTPFASGAGIQETITGLNALGALVVGLGTNVEANLAPRQGLEALAKLTGAVNQSTTTIANGTADAIAPGDPLYFQISSGFANTVADGITNAIQNAVTTVALDITVRASDPRVHITNYTGALTGVGAGETATFDVEFTGDGRPHRFDLQFVRAGTNVVVGSIPVVLGTPVVGDNYGYDELEDGEIHRSSHFGNYVENVAPTFVAGADVVVAEDSGAFAHTAWATDISPGAPWESSQVLNFVVENDNPALFSTPPAISPSGALTFTPAPNAHGLATIVVRLHDDGGIGLTGADTSAPQTITIQVDAVPDAPVALADSYFGDADSLLVVATAEGVLANDNDPDGDTLTAQLVDAPLHGTIFLQPDGSFEYLPDAGYFGADSFTYAASDGVLSSPVTTVSLVVNRSNVAPTASDESYATNEDTPLTVSAPGVLANDSDADGDALTATLIAGPAHGTLTFRADGSFDYSPNHNYSGADSFTYQAHDGRVGSNLATVSLTVVPSNRAPVAADHSFGVNEDTTLNVAAPGVILGSVDADGDPLTAALIVGPSHGTLTLLTNGSFAYVPATNYFGADQFTYRLNDGQADSNDATVAITVASVNDAPVAIGESFTTLEDTTLTVAAPGVLSNDGDVEGSPLAATLVRNALHGAVTLAADGALQYVPVANYAGPDSFTYSVSDGEATSATVTVSLTVTAVNDAPVAVGNAYNATEDLALSVSAPGVLTGDVDVDGDVLRAVLVSPPSKGSLTLNANGSFVYTPQANVNGGDSFTYKANDGKVDSNVVTVTLNVAAVPDAPVAQAEHYNVDQNQVLSVSAPGLLANDSDGDGDMLQANLVAAPAHGTLTLAADGSFVYTPAAGYNGPDSFAYQASDGALASAVTTVAIDVLPPPPPSTKFFVADQDSKAVYQYGADGTSVTNNALNKSNSKPRGIATNGNGSTLWVVDGGGAVWVYDKNGALLGQWQPQNAGKPEGVTVWGSDLWFVDPTNDRVYYYRGGADLRSGRVSPTSSFALNSGNLNSTDLVTDGTRLWVLNDTATADKVFRYTTAGVLEGSWTTSASSPTPTGITLDPTNVNHLWIVDATTDRVYQYDAGTTRVSGAQEPSVSFGLATTNTNPQGIADPLMDRDDDSARVDSSRADSLRAYSSDDLSASTESPVEDRLLRRTGKVDDRGLLADDRRSSSVDDVLRHIPARESLLSTLAVDQATLVARGEDATSAHRSGKSKHRQGADLVDDVWADWSDDDSFSFR